MNLFEAFKALDALNEDTFSVSDDGIAKLDEFQNDDELTDDIDVIDTEAETEDDLQDSYVGKVILDCGVCHSKIYKDKEEVELNEDQTLANVGEECPFCSTSDGFKIIGQVEDYSAENDEPETTDDEQPAEDDDTVEESLSVSPTKDDIRDDKTESPTDTLAEGIFGPSKKKKAQMEREREEREYQERQNQRKKDSQAWQDWCNQANANAAANKQRQDAERRARAEMRRADRERISKYSTGGGNTGHGGVHYSGGDYWESLEEAAAGTLERPMSAMGGTLSNIMTAHKDELSSIFDRESAMSFLDSIEPEVKNKGYLNTVRTKLERVPNNRISQFLYNIILKGDGMGTKMESIKEAYTDVDGVMGEKGAKYTEDDLKAYWDKENETDPVLADYKGNYQAWLKDTTSSMKVENLEEGIFNKKKKLTQQQPKTKREEKWEVFDQWHKWSVGEYDTKAEAEEAAASRGDDGRYRVQLVTKSLKESKSINEAISKDSLPDGWQKDERTLNRYIYHNDRFFASASISNSVADPRNIQTIIQIIDKVNPDNAQQKVDIVKISDVDTEWDNVLLNTIIKANNLLKELVEDEPSDESKSINESVNNVNVETDDSIVNVSSDENGKVTVTTEPITATDTASEGGDVLAPVDAETQDTIMNGTSEEDNISIEDTAEEPVDGEEAPAEGGEVDAEVDEFVEESFNHLCGSYLREVYDNVESFETSEVKENDKGLVVEGLIKFDSGNTKKTSFILEAKDCTRSGHCRFVGSNKHLSESADPYLITGKISEGKLICESLSYNYTVDSEEYTGIVRRG